MNMQLLAVAALALVLAPVAAVPLKAAAVKVSFYGEAF